MIDTVNLEKVSHSIDDVLMYMSHTHELEALSLASIFMARLALMCNETGCSGEFLALCKSLSENTMEQVIGEFDETKVD